MFRATPNRDRNVNADFSKILLGNWLRWLDFYTLASYSPPSSSKAVHTADLVSECLQNILAKWPNYLKESLGVCVYACGMCTCVWEDGESEEKHLTFYVFIHWILRAGIASSVADSSDQRQSCLQKVTFLETILFVGQMASSPISIAALPFL